MAERRDELIARREWAGFTHEQLAERLGCSIGAISSWERGLRTPGPRLRRPLAEALGVTLVELDRLLGLQPAQDLEGHLVQKWLSHYDSLVLAAGHIVTVCLRVVPHLLQTRPYSAMVERTLPGATEDQVGERILTRLERQRALYRDPEPLKVTAVIEETVFLSGYGGAKMMLDQLDHLTDMARHPSVEVLALPADGRATCIASEFELLTKPDDVLPFMAYTADPSGPNYHEGAARMKPFVDMYEHIMRIALTPGETIRLINDHKAVYRRQC